MDFLGPVYFWDINSLNQTYRQGTLAKFEDNANLYKLIPESSTFDEDKNLPYIIENTKELIGTIDTKDNIFRCIDKVRFKNSRLTGYSLKELKIMKSESELKDYKDFKDRVVDKNVIKNSMNLSETILEKYPHLSEDISKKSFLYFFSGPESLVKKYKEGYFNSNKTKFFENNRRDIEFKDEIISHIKDFNKLTTGDYIFLNYTIAYDIEKKTDNLYHILIDGKTYLIILMDDDDEKQNPSEDLTGYFSTKYKEITEYSAGGKRNSVSTKKNKKSKTIKTVYRKNNRQSSRKSIKSRTSRKH
jgi:hypothetical protein